MLAKRYSTAKKFEIFDLYTYSVQENTRDKKKVKPVNTKIFERPAERPDAEFVEMYFDEAPSWCGRGMNEGDKKQS